LGLCYETPCYDDDDDDQISPLSPLSPDTALAIASEATTQTTGAKRQLGFEELRP
jgi:hypothetical protein